MHPVVNFFMYFLAGRVLRPAVVMVALWTVLGVTFQATAGELLRNNDFSLNLESWRKPPSLAGWSPLTGTTLDLDPAADFRGDLIWQPLNIPAPAGEMFTFAVEMARVEAELGSAITFFIEFIDGAGELQRDQLLAVSNSQVPLAGEGWLPLQRQWLCPPLAQRLTRLVVARTGSGHLLLQNPTLSHETITAAPVPVVTAMTPVSGPYGTNITITGTNFGSTTGKIYLNTVSDEWYNSETLTIVSWVENQIIAQIRDYNNSGGEIIVVTGQHIENSEVFSFELTSSAFSLATTSQAQTVVQGIPLTVTFSLMTSSEFATDSYGINFVFDGVSCNYNSNCSLSPENIIPEAGQTVPISLVIDTSNMPPGHYEDYLQTIENSSYARFSKFEFDITPRGESPNASGITEFQGDGAVESGMGLPKYRINLATLDPVLESCLFRMKTDGPPIRLDLWYLGPKSNRDGLFGKGWRLNYESAITRNNNTATLFTTAGKILNFTTWQSLEEATEETPVVLNPPDGNHDTLTCYGSYYLFVEKSTKLQYRYEQEEITGTEAYLTAITDRNSQSITLQTDLETGAISSITDESGRSFSLSYNGENHCTSLRAPDGRYYSFNYINDSISSMTDPAGYVGRYSYDMDGFMTLMSSANKQTRFSYAARPGLTGDKFVQLVTDNEGQQTRYDFKSGEAGVTRVTDSRGHVSQHHSVGGKPTISIDPTGELRQIGYQNQRPALLSDQSGTTRMEYDTRGNLTRVIDNLHKEAVMTYDSHDNLLSHTDALDNTWSYQYDSKDNLIEVVDPLSGRVSITRDSRGRITAVTDQNNHTRHVYYDSWGNPSSYIDPLGNVTEFTYGNNGMRLLRITDANGDYKDISYDNLDRITAIDYLASPGDELLGSRTFQWDAFGSTGFTNELGVTFTNTRNSKGQVTSSTDPEGGVTSFEYDSVGNRVKKTDPLGRITTYNYDAANRLTETIDPLGNITRRTYEAGGQLQQLQDPNNNLTFWKYDARGQEILQRDAAGEIIRIERDSIGRPLRRFNARGQEIQYSYDKLGNMTRKLVYGEGVQYDYFYDSLGSMTSMTGADGTTSYQYTDRGEVSSISYPNGAEIQFTYDSLGNLLTITYPDGQTASYQYDDFNRTPLPEILRNRSGEFMGLTEPAKKATSITWNSSNISFSYNAASMPTTISRSNGIDTELSYDDSGRHVQIRHLAGSNPLEEMQMEFNLSGEMTRQSIAGTALFPSAANGTATINSLNQLSDWAGAVYTYDEDGNLTSAGGRFSALYDAENHLTSLTRGGSTETYGYNGLGQRVSRTASTSQFYLYDRSGRLLCITDGSGIVIHNIIYAGAAVVAFGSGANGYQYPLFDSSGNVTALTSDSGTILASYRYLPFGQVKQTGGAVDNPFTFSGIFGVLDQGDGIYAMRKRFYDATVSKFFQRDPLGIAGGVNLYTYGDNNPLIKSDPGGENPFLIGAFLLWGGSRIYNAYGTAKHAVDTANNAAETVDNAKATARSFTRAKQKARTMSNLEVQQVEGLDRMIALEDRKHEARIEAFNSGVDVKDNVMETAASAGRTAYHGARAVQGLIGATAPEPTSLAGKAAEMLSDASFNEVDKVELDWESVRDINE